MSDEGKKEPKTDLQDLPGNKIKKSIKERVTDFFGNPKKRLMFIIGVGLLIILLFGIGIYFLVYRNKPADESTSNETKNNVSTEVKPTLYESVLDGVMTENKDKANQHPLAIIVENHVDARPQSGLDKASVVYEAEAEGGITRFLGIFGENDAEKVGPVRSIRTYFVDLAHGLSAYLAHVGGNIDALDQIQAEKSPDLDQFRYSAPYWREYSAGLATEHTMYTSTAKLREQAKTNNYGTENNFAKYKFKDDPAAETRPAAQSIKIDYSNSSYIVGFQYDPTTNSYKRTLAGKPHSDRITKTQLSPKNVIVMSVSQQTMTTRINEQGLKIGVVGSGKARIYIDGKETIGTWKKNSKTDREIFYDETGKEMVFNRGQFWICLTSTSVPVTVQ